MMQIRPCVVAYIILVSKMFDYSIEQTIDNSLHYNIEWYIGVKFMMGFWRVNAKNKPNSYYIQVPTSMKILNSQSYILVCNCE